MNGRISRSLSARSARDKERVSGFTSNEESDSNPRNGRISLYYLLLREVISLDRSPNSEGEDLFKNLRIIVRRSIALADDEFSFKEGKSIRCEESGRRVFETILETILGGGERSVIFWAREGGLLVSRLLIRHVGTFRWIAGGCAGRARPVRAARWRNQGSREEGRKGRK